MSVFDSYAKVADAEYLVYRGSGGLDYHYPILGHDEQGVTVQASEKEVTVPRERIGEDPWFLPHQLDQ